MGREAQVLASVDGEVAEVKALLEGQEVILRGTLRRRFPRSAITAVTVADGALLFRCAGAAVRLALGEAEAAAWERQLLKPPPGLRDKLGLGPGVLALVFGPEDEPALVAALAGHCTTDPGAASLAIARVDCAAALEQARQASAGLPLWVVHAKGRATGIGDGAVRAALRAAGWRDTKTCAVSERFTATRYHPPPAGRPGG